jgi:hypothetical protein
MRRQQFFGTALPLLFIVVCGLHMLHHSLYCIFSCYPLSTKPDVSCIYTDMGCALIKVISF